MNQSEFKENTGSRQQAPKKNGLIKKMARDFLADSTAQQCTIKEIAESLLASRF